MPTEILVDWSTVNGPGKVSVFYFTSTAGVSTCRTALASFLTDADGILCTTTAWTIRTTGRTLDDTTGAITAAWTGTTAHSGAGAQTGEQAADASQVLVRWKTPTIVGRRFLQGRTFLPGVATAAMDDGNITSGARTTVLTAATNLLAAAVGMGVWHRPVGGSGGQFAVSNVADVWTEFAVLRRRRG